MYVSLAGTDQCNSTLSKNIQFGKDIQLFFFNMLEFIFWKNYTFLFKVKVFEKLQPSITIPIRSPSHQKQTNKQANKNPGLFSYTVIHLFCFC